MISHRSPFFHPAIPAALLLCWLSGLWILSSLSGSSVKLPTFPHVDKVAHAVYFLVGGFLSAWLLRVLVQWPAWRIVTVVVLTLVAVGALDEIHQLFTPGRSGADFGDWLADGTGGLIGACIFLSFYGLLTRITHSSAPAAD
jgi:VanZ family protein